MLNEIIFLFSIVFIAVSAIGALYAGPVALTALVCLQVVLMNLFVTKQILLCGMHATTADALGIGAVLGINLLREYYGASIARRTVYLSFAIVIFYTIITWLQLAYVPSACDVQQQHFIAILGHMPRILAASLFTYMLVESLEYYLYDYFKRIYNTRFFIARNYGVVLVTQLLDTILFTFLGLYGLVDNLYEIIIVSYLIKAITVIFMTPLLSACKKLIEWFEYVKV
ncbi:MAG: queuosine precursor transporter [Candidatus Babeliaceae bacterium]|nr:queuosine precursor transporter [Candidatus Babeliaceae bacterium]